MMSGGTAPPRGDCWRQSLLQRCNPNGSLAVVSGSGREGNGRHGWDTERRQLESRAPLSVAESMAGMQLENHTKKGSDRSTTLPSVLLLLE